MDLEKQTGESAPLPEPEVSADLLLGVLRDVWFPPTRLGSLVVSDEGAWRHVVARSTAAERIHMLVALGPELLAATEGGRARLAAQVQRARDVDDRPSFYGDIELLGAVDAALALVPPVVKYAVQGEVAFLSVGVSSRAWTGSARFVDAAGRRKGRVIVLGPNVDVLGILHEIAHAFLARPLDEESMLVTAEGEVGLRALAAVEGWSHRIDEHVCRDERLADALALGWLYAEPDHRLPA